MSCWEGAWGPGLGAQNYYCGVICELTGGGTAFMTFLGFPDTAFSGVLGPHGTGGNTESHSKAVCRP